MHRAVKISVAIFVANIHSSATLKCINLDVKVGWNAHKKSSPCVSGSHIYSAVNCCRNFGFWLPKLCFKVLNPETALETVLSYKLSLTT